MGKFENISIETLRKTLKATGGNLSKTAEALGVNRTNLYKYAKNNPEWEEAIADSRGNFLDDCLSTARVLALGIGKFEEEFDPELGKKVRKMVGWESMPDTNMLRFLIARLGAKEGFGDYQRGADNEGNSDRIDTIEIEVTYNKKEDLDLQKRMKKDEAEV